MKSPPSRRACLRAFLFVCAGVSACACGSSSASDDGSKAADASARDATTDRESDASAVTDAGPLANDDAGDGSAVAFDLSRDMSFAQNPNGPWAYGFTSGTALTVASFVLDTFTASAPPGMFWHPGDADAGGAYYPYIAQNTSDASAYGSSNGWSARAFEVTMEASNSGQYAVARFTAPVAGSFSLTFHAEGVHFGLSSTNVAITKNDASLFTADIEGYGGDPAFHAVEGSSPTADFSATVTLAVGDVMLFALGYGANMTNYSDTTGMFVHLDKL